MVKKDIFISIAKAAGRQLYAKRADILTGLGIAGMIGGAILTGLAAVKAREAIEKRKKDLGLEEGTDLSVKEKTAATWKIFAPAAAAELVSAGMIIGASTITHKQSAALTAACTLSEAALSEYTKKAVEVVGEKADGEIRDRIAEDKVKANPPQKDPVVVVGDTTGTRCVDTLTGREFTSSASAIRRAILKVQERLINEWTLSLNEVYDELGIDHNDLGDELGWKMEDGLIDVRLTAVLLDDDKPCLAMSFTRPPVYCYPH